MSPLTIASMTTSPVGRQIDVDGVGVAEQVVQVAEDFLIRPDQERRQVIGLAVVTGAAAASASRRGGR